MPADLTTASSSGATATTPPSKAAAGGLRDGLGDALTPDGSLADPLTGPSIESNDSSDAPEDSARPHGFDVDGESHTVWTQQVDGELITFVASHPMPILTRLRRWRTAAKKSKDPVLQKHLNRLLDIAFSKLKQVETASALEDGTARAAAIERAQPALAGSVGVLFRAFDVAYAGIGASAVYRGLHFSRDWQAKRGRTVAKEADRSFDEIKAEGSYSSATYELATSLAGDGAVKPRHLQAATETIDRVLQIWKDTTNLNREDESGSYPGRRKALDAGIAKFRTANNPVQEARLTGLKEGMADGFTQAGHQYENQFVAALSRYIDNQKLFESEMSGGSSKGYADVPFKTIPFISTTKVASEGVKYAEGKLTDDINRSDVGIIGRVLVYVAPTAAMLEAGGIDVWAGLKEGTLNFTTYRKAENEITFASSIPDEFLRGMTPVDATKDTATNAAAAELEAAKNASVWGGLNPLPLNED